MLKRSFFVLLFFLVTSHAVSAMEDKQLVLSPTPKPVSSWLGFFAFFSGGNEETQKKELAPSAILPNGSSKPSTPRISVRDLVASGEGQGPEPVVITEEPLTEEEQKARALEQLKECQRAACARLYYNHCGGRPVTPPGESKPEQCQGNVLKISLEYFPGAGCCK